jgi:hypothetical protein
MGAPNQIQEEEMAGYLLVPNAKVPETYNAGFSMYVAAWPLLRQYPGHRFQTGLFGTWMFAQYDGHVPTDMYSDVEGGLGWWTDTRFATETPNVPSIQSVDKKGETYARVAPTSFPRGPGGDSVLVHRVTSYSKKALWVRVWLGNTTGA